jgi:hypothetical protein
MTHTDGIPGPGEKVTFEYNLMDVTALVGLTVYTYIVHLYK